MAVEAANASWLTLVTSSAVISGLVNVAWGAWAKRLDRKREDAKDAHRMGHVYLTIALQFEEFAQRCNAYLYDIHEGLWHRAHHHDETPLDKLNKPFEFAFDPEPNWVELPVAFAAKVKVLPSQFQLTHEWIGRAFSEWADPAVAFHLEEERVAYYGIKACQIASQIREDTGAGPAGDNLNSYLDHFRMVIESRRETFRAQREGVTLIP